MRKATEGRKRGRHCGGRIVSWRSKHGEQGTEIKADLIGRDPRKGRVKSRAGGTLWRKSEGLAASPAFFLGVGWDLSKKGEFVKEGY